MDEPLGPVWFVVCCCLFAAVFSLFAAVLICLFAAAACFCLFAAAREDPSHAPAPVAGT